MILKFLNGLLEIFSLFKWFKKIVDTTIRANTQESIDEISSDIQELKDAETEEDIHNSISKLDRD